VTSGREGKGERRMRAPSGLVVEEAAAAMAMEVASGEAAIVWMRRSVDVGEEEPAM
jgi:hypothetical protein